MEQQKHLPVRGKYRHFKGMEYEVVGIAHHSETMEDMVLTFNARGLATCQKTGELDSLVYPSMGMGG